MEENSHFDSFELQFTRQAQGFYREASKWATFLSIMGFIATALLVLVGLMMFALGDAFGDSMAGNPMAGFMTGGILGVFYLVFAALNFFPALYMYKFASKTREALYNNDTNTLTASFENLKSYFKFTGIVVISVIGIYVLIFILAIVGAVGAAAGM